MDCYVQESLKSRADFHKRTSKASSICLGASGTEYLT